MVSGVKDSCLRYLYMFKRYRYLRKRYVYGKALMRFYSKNVAENQEVLRNSESTPETPFERANVLLRYAIGVLRGRNIRSKVKGRIAIALLLKSELEDMGQWWQARILSYWIHRAQGGEFGE